MKEPTESTTPPTWDGPRFARWLRRWKDAEELEWEELAAKSGLSTSSWQQAARGTVLGRGSDTSPRSTDPSINTVVRMAHGLGLELTYVVRQAGVDVHHDRWSPFNRIEREQLHQMLVAQCKLEHVMGVQTHPTMLRLMHELEATLATEETIA